MDIIIKIDSSRFEEEQIALVQAMGNDLRLLLADALYAYKEMKSRQASKGRSEILAMEPEPIDYTELEKTKVAYHSNKAHVSEILRQAVLLSGVNFADENESK